MAALAAAHGSMAASVRNRTPEFFAVVESTKARLTNAPTVSTAAARQQQMQQQRLSRSDFARLAAQISRGIAVTAAKLDKLTKLVKKKSLFDDRPVEIQELTFIIKQEIAQLNAQIAQLQHVAQAQRQSSISKQADEHSTHIVVTLQSKLASASNSFKDVLEARTENMRAQRDRREQFSASVASPARVSTPTSALYRRKDEGGRSDHTAIDFGGVMQAQQQFAQEEDTYADTRHAEIRNIESTIQQLGGIFQQLADLVAQQGEQVQRIDSNLDEVETNVGQAQKELVKYLQSISSDRWLMIKIFGVIITFFLIFVVFFA